MHKKNPSAYKRRDSVEPLMKNISLPESRNLRAMTERERKRNCEKPRRFPEKGPPLFMAQKQGQKNEETKAKHTPFWMRMQSPGRAT